MRSRPADNARVNSNTLLSKRSVRRLAVALPAAVLLAVAATAVFAAPKTAPAAKLAWVDHGIHVVGGPVAGGGRALVLVSAANKSIWLEAVDPATGAVRWRLPEGFSAITAGVETTPVAHGADALALVPVSASSPFVHLEGVDIATGKVVWRLKTIVGVEDAPSACPKPLGGKAFCLVVQTQDGETGLIALSPRTGAVLASVQNIERAMSTVPGVYQTDDSTPVLAGVATPGGIRWTAPVSKLFGPRTDPNYGWDFGLFGAIEAGTVGRTTTGHTEVLGDAETVGFSERTGRSAWTIPGATFDCGGSLGLSGAFLCVMTGTATGSPTGKLTTSKNATVKLEGFDPSTGKLTWKVPVGGLVDLLLGNVAIADAHRIVVTTRQGQKRLLDLRSGATASPAGTGLWCAHANFFTIRPPKGLPAERVGSSLFTSCDAGMHPVSAMGRPPAVAGATVGNTFIWAGKDALEAVVANP